MDNTDKKSRRMALVAVGAVALVIIAGGAIVYMVIKPSNTQQAFTPAQTTATVQVVASKEMVKQHLQELDVAIKQAAHDQFVSKSALKDGTNQIKVGS